MFTGTANIWKNIQIDDVSITECYRNNNIYINYKNNNNYA